MGAIKKITVAATVFSIASVAFFLLSGFSPLSLPFACMVASGLLCAVATCIPWGQSRSVDVSATPVDPDPPRTGGLSDVPSLLSSLRDGVLSVEQNRDDFMRFPAVSEIFASSDARELNQRIRAAASRIDRAERVLGALSDRVLTDSLILLPFADAIVASVPSKTEEATMTVLDKFMVAREASAGAAESAKKIRAEIGEGSDRSASYAASVSREAIKKERAAIKELVSSTQENRTQLSRMSEEISAGLDLLKSISEITERAKLIAFNMSIEAARIGEKGKGVKVIIAELHRLNDRTFEFSRQVSDLLNGFRQHTTRLVEAVEEKSLSVAKEVEKDMESTETAVERLIEASSRTEAFANVVAGTSEEIDRDLDGVLESMQFQDITRQMIEGAVNILRELRNTLDDCLERNNVDIDVNKKNERFSEIRKSLLDNAKTQGEKDAILEVRL